MGRVNAGPLIFIRDTFGVNQIKFKDDARIVCEIRAAMIRAGILRDPIAARQSQPTRWGLFSFEMPGSDNGHRTPIDAMATLHVECRE